MCSFYLAFTLYTVTDSGEDAKVKGTWKVGQAGKRKKEGILCSIFFQLSWSLEQKSKIKSNNLVLGIYLFHILIDSWAPDMKQEPSELKQRVLQKQKKIINKQQQQQNSIWFKGFTVKPGQAFPSLTN